MYTLLAILAALIIALPALANPSKADLISLRNQNRGKYISVHLPGEISKIDAILQVEAEEGVPLYDSEDYGYGSTNTRADVELGHAVARHYKDAGWIVYETSGASDNLRVTISE